MLKNTKSPGCKFDLLTVFPYPDCALDVLGKFTPAAFLNTYDVNPEQSNVFGPSAPQTYGHPCLEYAKFKTACTFDVLDAGGLYELLFCCDGFVAGF